MRIIFIVLSIFYSASIASQQSNITKIDTSNTEKLEKVIITGTRTKRTLASLPLNADIIAKNDIEKNNSSRLSDIINEQTGLITIPDFGGVEGIQMQGLDSQYTLILLDNQPLIGRSAGTFDLNRVTLGNVNQIEIIRGASSSLYGNEALAGVINIISEKPKNGFTSTISSLIQTNNTFDNSISVSFKNKKFYTSIFHNIYSSDGYDLKADDQLRTVNKFNNNTSTINLGFKLNNEFKAYINLRRFEQTIDNISTNNLKGESEIDEKNSYFKITYNSDLFTSQFNYFTSNYNTYEYLNDISGNLYSDSYYNHNLQKPEFINTINLKNSKIVLGLGYKSEKLNRTFFYENPKQNSPFIYLQHDLNIGEKINIITGARYDKFSNYRSQISPKLAMKFNINDRNSLKFSIGYGFKSPEFRQLYFNFVNSTIGYSVVGYNVYEEVINQLIDEGQIAGIIVPIEEFNNRLKPESSLSINLGFDHTSKQKFKLKSNFFLNKARNLIDTRIVATKINGQSVFSYHNIDKVSTFGMEVSSDFRINKYLKFLLGYQLLYAFDENVLQEFINGNVYARVNPTSPAFRLKKSDYFGLFNRSRHMGVFKISYDNILYDFQTNLRIRYRGKYALYDTNDNNYLDKFDNFIKGYFITNFSINKYINYNLNISAGINNIFNFRNPENISNIFGRLYYFRLKINFITKR